MVICPGKLQLSVTPQHNKSKLRSLINSVFLMIQHQRWFVIWLVIFVWRNRCRFKTVWHFQFYQNTMTKMRLFVRKYLCTTNAHGKIILELMIHNTWDTILACVVERFIVHNYSVSKRWGGFDVKVSTIVYARWRCLRWLKVQLIHRIVSGPKMLNSATKMKLIC